MSTKLAPLALALAAAAITLTARRGGRSGRREAANRDPAGRRGVTPSP